ncbi:MAG: alcohol dehydrogenase catalytic domain-containing protein [Methylobacteriaceae bacterium]|nr:alcohol dehydrogenase catalytic domain-containing protein [Methylobacteriaceae bacterium]
MQTRAAFASRQNVPIAVDLFDLEGPRAGEVLIGMKAAGLCHSDMSFFDGSRAWSDYPIVLGHEGAGVVLDCGPGVTSVRPGDHVIPVGIPECGECPACRSRKTNLCDRYFQPTERRPFSRAGRPIRAFCELGTFSDRIVAREMQVTKIRKDAPLDIVCCMGCAGATGVGSAIFAAKVEPGSSAVVFGLGGIGLNVVEGCRIAGASRIIGVDVNAQKEQAGRIAGMTDFLDAAAGAQATIGAIRDLTGGGADYAFECVGAPDILRQAVECTRIGWGTIVSIGIFPGAQEMALRPRSIQEGRRLLGAYLGNVKTRSELPQLVDWLMDGRLRMKDLISHRIGLGEIAAGFALLARGEARRVVVDF